MKKNGSALDFACSLEESSDLVGHALAPFLFIGGLYEVMVFLCLAHVGSDDRIHHAWL